MKNNCNKMIFVFLFLFLFLVPFISAQPPFQQTTIIGTGIEIEAPIVEFIEVGQTFNFHIHPHNASDGLLIPQGDIDYCTIHVYDNTGAHIVEENMTADSNAVKATFRLPDNSEESGYFFW